MALRDPLTNNYWKLHFLREGDIHIEADFWFIVYRDVEHRQSGGDEFTIPKRKHIRYPDNGAILAILNYTPEPNKTDEENIATALYEYAKTLPQFQGFIDV